MSNLC